jgi:hypothetical protein
VAYIGNPPYLGQWRKLDDRRLLIDSAGALTLDTGDATIYGVRVGRGVGAISSNTVVGSNALASTTSGGDNTSVGYGSLTNNTDGSSNCAFGVNSLNQNGSGIKNTAYGRQSLYLNVSGSENTVIGSYAGYNNTGANNICIGSESGYGLTTGSNNTIIGSIQGTAGLANTVIIGAGTTERLRIDSSGNVGIGTSSPQLSNPLGEHICSVWRAFLWNWRMRHWSHFRQQINVALRWNRRNYC